MKLYDLDQERGTVFIRQGKGKKDRMIPMGERAFAWVRRYLEEARPSLALTPDDGIVFLTNVGLAVRAEPADPARARLRGRGRDRQDGRLPPVPPHVRHADAGERRGHPVHPADARARETRDDPDLRPGQSIRMLKEVHTRTHPARLTLDADTAELAEELAEEAAETAAG